MGVPKECPLLIRIGDTPQQGRRALELKECLLLIKYRGGTDEGAAGQTETGCSKWIWYLWVSAALLEVSSAISWVRSLQKNQALRFPEEQSSSI